MERGWLLAVSPPLLFSSLPLLSSPCLSPSSEERRGELRALCHPLARDAAGHAAAAATAVDLHTFFFTLIAGPSRSNRARETAGCHPPSRCMGGATLMLLTPSQLSSERCEGVACLRPRQAGRAREGRERGRDGGSRREGGEQRARIAAGAPGPSTPPGG